MKRATFESAPNRPRPDAGRQQLPSRNYPMLATRQLSKHEIDVAVATTPRASFTFGPCEESNVKFVLGGTRFGCHDADA